jgi:hypothetical protein
MRCSHCDTVLEPGDSFCGGCGRESGAAGNGRPASADFGTASFQRIPAPRTGDPSGRFFAHTRARPAGRMTNATRYLCAGAYLSPGYANNVIRQLVSSHRAIAPSVGIDVGPIIRHCLRARQMRLGRDLLLAVLLLASLILDPEKTVIILLIAFFVGFLPSVNWAHKSLGIKIFAALGSLFLLGTIFSIVTAIGLVSALERLSGSAGGGLGSLDQGSGVVEPAASSSPKGLISTILLVVIVLIQIFYTYVRTRTLSHELGPDAPARRPGSSGASVDARIARAEAAQYGNLALYSGESPFLGTGKRTRAWSIAIELERADGGRQPLPGLSPAQGWVPIDPVELHQVVRDRLLKLQDDGLPPNERLSALTVQHHVVGLGQYRWDSPVVDPVLNVPYSEVSPEAVAALIRHPQAGLRYYQRVSVCDEGQAVWAGGEKVVDGSDQDISTSAFLYIAVEGRMLYLEFVATVMPPIMPYWHSVDFLPKISAPMFILKVILDAFSSIFQALIYSPFRAVGSLISTLKEGRTYQEEKTAARDYVYGDIGARVSVRGLGAVDKLETYIQTLDAEKYTKLVERLINDTVLDFLAAKGVNTTAFANSATTVMNSGVIIGANATFNGPAAFGAGAMAQQTAQPQQARA